MFLARESFFLVVHGIVKTAFRAAFFVLRCLEGLLHFTDHNHALSRVDVVLLFDFEHLFLYLVLNSVDHFA